MTHSDKSVMELRAEDRCLLVGEAQHWEGPPAPMHLSPVLTGTPFLRSLPCLRFEPSPQ